MSREKSLDYHVYKAIEELMKVINHRDITHGTIAMMVDSKIKDLEVELNDSFRQR